MVRQILSNNNEKCHSNFSPTFHQPNTPGLHVFNIFVVKTQQGFAAAGMALDVGTLELEATGTGKRSLGSRQ
jgi:hypothetical protein